MEKILIEPWDFVLPTDFGSNKSGRQPTKQGKQTGNQKAILEFRTRVETEKLSSRNWKNSQQRICKKH
jgi:hypothetical protein